MCPDCPPSLGLSKHTQAGEGVGAVNVHGARAANTLSAGAAEGEGRIDLVLDADEGVENHRPRLVEVEGVGLHAGLLGRLVGIPAVDLEGLEFGILARGGGAVSSARGKVGHAADGSRNASSGDAKGGPRGGRAEEGGGRGAESGHGNCRRNTNRHSHN